jgi:hypothetical protein
MRAETAAGYVDEPSVEAFLAKVRQGVYPKPLRQEGCLPKWHRLKLDHAVAQRHHIEGPAVVEDVTGLI